jgi:hypothetical protein
MKFAVILASFITSGFGAQLSKYGKHVALISGAPGAAPAASPATSGMLNETARTGLSFPPAPAPALFDNSEVSLEDADAVSIKFQVANYDYNQIFGDKVPPPVVEDASTSASNDQLQWAEGDSQKKGVVLTVLRRSGRDAQDSRASVLMEDSIRDAINKELIEAGFGSTVITVVLSPGESRLVESSDPGAVGRALKVDAFFATDVANDKETLKKLVATLEQCYHSGALLKSVSVALYKLTGLEPQIHDFDVEFKDIAPWSSDACQTHMTGVVKRLTVAYTRRMVPASLFWECTNYMVQLSFSHDRAVTAHDRTVCQRIVAEFSAEWNFGEGKALPVTIGPMSDDSDVTRSRTNYSLSNSTDKVHNSTKFVASTMSGRLALNMSGFCTSVCEVKFGIGAVLCK